LKLELNSVTSEVDSAIEIIGIPKEELGITDTEVRNNTSTQQRKWN
jgi:hypothetical protein